MFGPWQEGDFTQHIRERTMIFQGLFNLIWRMKWVVLTTIPAMLLMVAVGSRLTRPTYASTAMLLEPCEESPPAGFIACQHHFHGGAGHVREKAHPAEPLLVNSTGVLMIPPLRMS